MKSFHKIPFFFNDGFPNTTTTTNDTTTMTTRQLLIKNTTTLKQPETNLT